MGHEVEKAALARKHNVVVTIDNAQEWEERINLLKQADVAIDFSQPDQVVGNIHRCFDFHLDKGLGRKQNCPKARHFWVFETELK